MKNILVGLSISALSFSAVAQTELLTADFTTEIPDTWTILNEDGLTPEEPVADFTEGWIQKVVGTDTAAASTSYYTSAESSEDYLITPKVDLGNFSRLVWNARSVDASYPDGYYVLISTTDSLPGSFTDTLLTVDAETPYWQTYGIELDELGYNNQPVYIAFRNKTTEGYILLVDNVKVLGAETASLSPSKKEINLTVFPNPVTDVLMINYAKSIQKTTVFTMNGQKLFSSNTKEIPVSNIQKGVYFVRIETDEGVVTKKFTKL